MNTNFREDQLVNVQVLHRMHRFIKMSYNNISRATPVGWCGRIDRVYDVEQCPVTAWIVCDIHERRSTEPTKMNPKRKGVSIGLSCWDVIQRITRDMIPPSDITSDIYDSD